MQRRSLFLACLAAVGLAAGPGGSQNESSGQAIRLRFTDRGAELAGLSIQYFLGGPFGGFGNLVRTAPDVREYIVETSREGQPATMFKAIIYCPGKRIVLLTRSAVAGRLAGTVSIKLEALERVPLSGRLVSEATGQDLNIEALYQADWAHSFFGIVDGPVASFTVATTKVAADGTFALEVPDFAHDPVVTSFDERAGRGVLRFGISPTGNISYRLEELQQAGREMRLPIATGYPRDLLLVAVSR